MFEELDAAVANQLVRTAMHNVRLPQGNAVLCTKRQLEAAMRRLAQEAYAMGFLSAKKEQFASLALPGTAERPAWMDIRLDDPQDLAKHQIRLRPVVQRSLIGAGYRCLGDLCWVPDHELRKLYYIGRATTRELRNIIRRLQTRPLEGGHDS